MKKNHRPSSRRTLFLYGKHPVEAALKNPLRHKIRLFLTQSMGNVHTVPPDLPVQIVNKEDLERLLPIGALHQGIALETEPLPFRSSDDIISTLKSKDSAIIVALDQVTDPHNIGAVLRSCAAFGADALLLQDKNAPEETGVLAKSACGALEIIPVIRAVNFVRTLEAFKKAGFWTVGMDGKAEKPLTELDIPLKTVFIMGSEGEGMRHLTLEACDFLTKLPISPAMESLNVSNAAAITLYEASQRVKKAF